jgi:hypothetical protein
MNKNIFTLGIYSISLILCLSLFSCSDSSEDVTITFINNYIQTVNGKIYNINAYVELNGDNFDVRYGESVTKTSPENYNYTIYVNLFDALTNSYNWRLYKSSENYTSGGGEETVFIQ